MNLDEERRQFRDYLREKGLRYTRERQMVLDIVLSGRGHLNVADVQASLKNEGYHVSRATVYRTLHLLTESGLVERVRLGEAHQHYEPSPGFEHHDHLVCLKCGRIIEFYDPDLEKRQNRIYRHHRFHAKNHNLQVFGLCDDCWRED
jgi:Fur family ferric uptake transcriptional regulator